MARSSAQRLLRTRRHELRLHFLPRRFSKLGNYSDTQRHLAGAFRIFFASELENYFEVVARSIAKFAESEWTHGRASLPFAALLSRNNNSFVMPQETSSIKPTHFVERKFKSELESVRKLINENNGSKSQNILKIFVPLGINECSIDPRLLSECDSLGSDRGFLAHQTGGRAAQLIDPRTEYDRAITIVGLLDDFEALLNA